MNLGDFRERIAKDTGHYDLVDPSTFADNGMNRFINDGCRQLDRMFAKHQRSRAWLYKRLAAGESVVTFNQARIVREVWLEDGTERTQLQRKDFKELRELYDNVPLSAVTTGEPLYWNNGVYPLAPDHLNDANLDEKAELEAADHTDTDLVIYSNPSFVRGLYVMPPADQAYSLLVLADWEPIELSDDADQNFWTNYPDILDLAVRAEMELKLHRNRTGYEDFIGALMARVRDLQRDYTAELVAIPASDAVLQG